MSRSYRHKGYTDRSFRNHGIRGSMSYTKYAKRQANKRVRNYDEELPTGSSYKKLYCQWDIHEYSFSFDSHPPEKHCADINKVYKMYIK